MEKSKSHCLRFCLKQQLIGLYKQLVILENSISVEVDAAGMFSVQIGTTQDIHLKINAPLFYAM